MPAYRELDHKEAAVMHRKAVKGITDRIEVVSKGEGNEALEAKLWDTLVKLLVSLTACLSQETESGNNPGLGIEPASPETKARLDKLYDEIFNAKVDDEVQKRLDELKEELKNLPLINKAEKKEEETGENA